MFAWGYANEIGEMVIGAVVVNMMNVEMGRKRKIQIAFDPHPNALVGSIHLCHMCITRPSKIIEQTVLDTRVV